MTLPYKHSLRASDLLNLGTVPSAKHICGKIGFRHGDANEAIQLCFRNRITDCHGGYIRAVVSIAIQGGIR